MRVFKNKMFFKWAKTEGLTDKNLTTAVNEIGQGLIDANLGGNLVKKRIARKGHGKSGGFRTIVAFQKGHKTFFIYGFQKSQRDNISEKEEKALKKLAHDLLNASDVELKEMISTKELYEVKI